MEEEIKDFEKIATNDGQSQDMEEARLLMAKCMKYLADEKGVSMIGPFWYFHRYKGFDYFKENFRSLRTLPIEQVVSEMIAVCEKNGGKLSEFDFEKYRTKKRHDGD